RSQVACPADCSAEHCLAAGWQAAALGDSRFGAAQVGYSRFVAQVSLPLRGEPFSLRSSAAPAESASLARSAKGAHRFAEWRLAAAQISQGAVAGRSLRPRRGARPPQVV